MTAPPSKAAGTSAPQGGLFRTDGGVKASSGLDVSDPAIFEAWEKVRADADSTVWMLLEYEGKGKLKVRATGSGGREELLENVKDDQVTFGGLRTQAGKFLALMCMGEDTRSMALPSR
eukprot:gnl/TRDRNA2_/TRDRNA2_176532_c8_seq1.p3 gnl/TRDRNA2_/TRDRNA2_176532_c8~~gnl/TRDRNA2_/TRDRNA2_176532_c8_seq1.p3  ORF type:complete len:118 (-),score=33.11 gnl/TRDRNA2_/TRDRNA2_176532_c8_seq1:204-557(-)